MSCPAVTTTSRTALELLLDVEAMTARLRAQLGSPALILHTATLVDHKPGNRAVVHYLGEQSGRAVAFYAKAYPEPARAAFVHDLVCRLCDVFAAAPDLRAPQPLGFDPDLALVVYAPVAGIPLDRLASRPELSSALGHAARWLCDRALEFYPESEFAKDYLRSHPGYKPMTQAAEPSSAIGAAIATGVLPSDVPAGPMPRRSRGRGR